MFENKFKCYFSEQGLTITQIDSSPDFKFFCLGIHELQNLVLSAILPCRIGISAEEIGCTWSYSGYREADMGSCSRQIKQLQCNIAINGEILTIKLSGVALPVTQATSVYELNEEQKMPLNFAFKMRIPRTHVAEVLLLNERQQSKLNYNCDVSLKLEEQRNNKHEE